MACCAQSANALLDQSSQGNFTAKVCDFGTSRHFRPSNPLVKIISSFTGRSSVVPAKRGEAGILQDGSGGVETSLLTVGVVDAQGTMTKATGTLLWMVGLSPSSTVFYFLHFTPPTVTAHLRLVVFADHPSHAISIATPQAPEAFRGDQKYSPSVDVYSFGIVLWEMCTRETPWDELGKDVSYIELIALLTDALQTGRRPRLSVDVEEAHPAFVAVMRACWAGDPMNRPSFFEVIHMLQHSSPNPRDTPVKKRPHPGVTSMMQPLLSEEW
jgi:serine/threonine protein kinase